MPLPAAQQATQGLARERHLKVCVKERATSYFWLAKASRSHELMAGRAVYYCLALAKRLH